MERTLLSFLKAAKDANQDVIVNIKPVYSGTSKRPDKFDVTYSIDDVRQEPAVLYNK